MNKYLKFDDLHEFWSFAFRESTAYIKDSRDYASDWNGAVSWEKAKVLATSGWIEGLREVQKVTVELSDILASKIERKLPEYDVAGGVLDVGAYLSGVPEYFIRSVPTEYDDQGKIIKIVCSIGCSAAITSSVIIQKGAMVAALIDVLETCGYRCEVIVNSASTYYSSRIEVDVCVKKSSESLNLLQLAFCVGHPTMLRRFIFSIRELEGWSDYVSNYGYSTTATDKGDLYINEIFSREVKNSEAIGWITKQLKTFGVTIKQH